MIASSSPPLKEGGGGGWIFWVYKGVVSALTLNDKMWIEMFGVKEEILKVYIWISENFGMILFG